jgi:uncharacterized protein YggE
VRLVRLIAAAALAAAAIPAAAAAQAIPVALAPGEVLLQVEAEGVARSRPDVMTISAGVTTTGRSAKEALAANNVLASRLLEAVRAQGVASGDVQTEQLGVRPQFDRADENRAGDEGRAPRITGYIANNSLELRLRDLGKAGDIVSALFEAGANNVRGPTFSLSAPASANRQARAAAVAAAREEADTYAAALNMRVSRVLRVSERGEIGREQDGYIMVTGSRVMRTPLAPGEVRTTARVWIDYALVPL